MKARLALYKDGKLQAAYPLPEPGTSIGRGDDNYIGLNDPNISRQHAKIHAKDNMWVIKDLESTNGIIVNGAQVKHAVLKNEDEISIGPFDFVFELAPDEAEWAPPHAVNPSSERRRKTLSKEAGPAAEPGGAKTVPRRPE
jgi:pSer/pThr/pTyr-binding forkhead associated (FHA) protein